MAFKDRGSNKATTDEGTTVTTEPSNPTADAAAKRTPRPKIDVGDVLVEESERTDFSSRATPLDSNPVAVAVKTAALGKARDLHVDADKVKGVISILRRAAARYNVRMNIAPAPYEASARGEGKVVLSFKTEAKAPKAEAQATSATTTTE